MTEYEVAIVFEAEILKADARLRSAIFQRGSSTSTLMAEYAALAATRRAIAEWRSRAAIREAMK
jgi:hypothetical protein